MAIETLGAALRQMNRLFAGGVVTGLSDAQLLERFAREHDSAAFEILVGRHGPMVLGVCRGILKDPNDAEDAFQATFLILVKKSGAFGGHVALGPWLYRVAHRVAIRANAAAARRQVLERRAGQMAMASSTSETDGPDEMFQALHEEIARLPERLRRAVILCDLQRVPRARAAGELRWSESTLQRRLGEGRQRLKARLIRRGLAHEGGILATMFLRAAGTPVPTAWGEATMRAAVAMANPAMAAGVVSASANRWTREVLKIMWLQKLTSASAALLAAGLIVWGASIALVSIGDEPSNRIAARPEAPLPKDAGRDTQPGSKPAEAPGRHEIRGRVLGPDGRPVNAAKLYQTPAMGYLMRPYPSPVVATTGADGRFAFTVSKAEILDSTIVVAAAAPGYGPGWVEVRPDRETDDLTLRLVRDDVPVTGRIIDLEGKPVRGASLRVLQINAARDESLDRWLAAAKAAKASSIQNDQEYLPRETIALSPTVTTDAEGRFRLTGIGRDRLVLAQLDGPTLASQYLRIRTRPGGPIEVPESERPPDRGELRILNTYYGADFQHAAAPCRPIVGVVRDRDTKQPIAGVTIRSYMLATRPHCITEIVRTTTDAEGRYRLTGMPPGRGNRIMAVPGADQPHPVRALDVPDRPGLEPVSVDVELRRGVWIEGRITDKETGQPVRGVAQYFSRFNNPNLSDYPGYGGAISMDGVGSKEDGSYRVVGLPGPGLIAVYHMDRYLLTTERGDEFGTREPDLNTAPYHLDFTTNYAAIARVNPVKGADSVRRDVTLDPGWSFIGTVSGPDGLPLAGALAIGLDNRIMSPEYRTALPTAEFRVHGFNLHRPRELIFQHTEKGLVGVARRLKANGFPIAVSMQPGATVVGRLVDADGRPRADVELKVRFRPKQGSGRTIWSEYFAPERIKTDREGRFRVAALLPGYAFQLSDGQGERIVFDGLGSGQTKDLGDVELKEEP